MSGAEPRGGSLTAGERTRRDAAPFLVELVGLPGAGKTAIATRLVADLRSRGMVCAERRGGPGGQGGRARHRVERALSLLRHHEQTRASLRFAASVRPRLLTPFARAIRLSGWMRQLSAYAVSDADVVVLDQGPIQDAWSVTVPSRSWSEAAMRGAVGPLVQVTEMPRALVYVDVEVETAAERLRLRRGTSSRFDGLSATQTRTWLAEYGKSLWAILEYAVAVSNASFARVDGRVSVDEASRQVARFLDDARGVSGPLASPTTATVGAAS